MNSFLAHLGLIGAASAYSELKGYFYSNLTFENDII